MHRTSQERPPKHISAKYMRVSQSVMWSSFEGHFSNFLLLFHIRVSSSLISEKYLWKPISTTWPLVPFKKCRSPAEGEPTGLSDRGTPTPLLLTLAPFVPVHRAALGSRPGHQPAITYIFILLEQFQTHATVCFSQTSSKHVFGVSTVQGTFPVSRLGALQGRS